MIRYYRNIEAGELVSKLEYRSIAAGEHVLAVDANICVYICMYVYIYII